LLNCELIALEQVKVLSAIWVAHWVAVWQHTGLWPFLEQKMFPPLMQPPQARVEAKGIVELVS
jgi:hypothetical protein